MEKVAVKKTLSAPLRVYWDIAAAGDSQSGTLAGRVARELRSLRVFFVTLRLLKGQRDDLSDILGLLGEGGVRVTVSIPDAGSFPGHDVLARASAVDLAPTDNAGLKRLLEKTAAGVAGGRPVSVSLVPMRDNTSELLEMVSSALDAGIGMLNLINPCLVYDRARAREFVIGGHERDALKKGLEGLLRGSPGVKLFVHDLFLHRSLDIPGLPGRIEYAGCQAGDAIMYIDSSFNVYPCATMPVALGSLEGKTVKEIWSAEGRRLLRERINKLPGACSGCPEAADCKGGCRGLAWEVGGEESMDPGCGRYTGLV